MLSSMVPTNCILETSASSQFNASVKIGPENSARAHPSSLESIPIETSVGASFQAFSPKTWLFLVLSGLATGLSWLCYFHALQVGPASRVAPIDKLSVVLVILFAALFLGEGLTWGKGVGGLLIVAGAVIIAVE